MCKSIPIIDLFRILEHAARILPNSTFVLQAVPTLQQIGIADAATLYYRGKLAFVAQIGKPALTVEGLLPRNATSAIIAVTLTGESDHFTRVAQMARMKLLARISIMTTSLALRTNGRPNVLSDWRSR